VSDGSMAAQRMIRTTLGALPEAITDVRPPAVWVVGEVVGLNQPHAAPGDDDADLD